MRENRTHGSEGGEDGVFPYPYRFQAQPEPPLALTLVLASALDQLVSPACSKSLAQHWSATLRIHPSAGHDMALDDGPWVAAQVKAWFSEFQNVRQK